MKMPIPTGQNFATCYIELCKKQRIRPLPVICVTLPDILDLTTDRVKMDDWGPILNSLSLDRSLKSVSVRSKYQCRKPLEEINSEGKARALSKSPVVLTRYLLEWLSHSVAQCVRNSRALTCLELEGVPLPTDCLAALCVGLAGTETLQHLSLRRCYIGDNSCAMVCRTIADVQSIRSLNLSQCDLSSNCGPALASALCRQKLVLYHDTWKDSLRYREPNLGAMPGLRRLTLNGNPHLGDTAIGQVIDAIQDSLWLKALDLQNCGLTDAIGNQIIDLLDHNTTLEVVDVRTNSNLSENVMQDILRRLEINNAGTTLEFRLLSLPKKDNRAVSESAKTRKKHEEIAKVVTRPKSAIIRNFKKPNTYMAPTRKYPSTPIISRKTNVKSSLSYLADKSATKVLLPVEKQAKVSLHLDLQQKIQSVVEDSWQHSPTNQLDNNSKMSRNKRNNRKVEAEESTKLDDVLSQLADAKADRVKLLEETRRMEMELKEERARREMVDTKLRIMQRNLADREYAAKELEDGNCVLMSQQSIDEISASFERLLEMLDDLAENPSARYREEEARADIKRKVTLLIRKTKSESLYKEFNKNNPTKFTQSETDMRTVSPPIQPLQLDKNIGDHPDSTASSLNGSSYRRQERLKPTFSPCERARAIFAQIVNGDVILNLGSHVR